MKIHLRDGLPLVSVALQYRHQQVALDDVLLDTGSASSVFSADRLLAMDSMMTFTPADFCIGESSIWFFSLMWEHGNDAEPVEFLDDKSTVTTKRWCDGFDTHNF